MLIEYEFENVQAMYQNLGDEDKAAILELFDNTDVFESKSIAQMWMLNFEE